MLYRLWRLIGPYEPYVRLRGAVTGILLFVILALLAHLL